MISDPNKPKKLSANEGIKENSDFLRGTITESLLDESTGSIPASDAGMLPVLSSSKLSEIVPRRKSLFSLIPSFAESFFGLFGSEIMST